MSDATPQDAGQRPARKNTREKPATARRPLARNHALVFEALKRAHRPMTAYELIDAVRDAGISAPPTVYRALNRLIEDGLAHRLESANAFIACSHEGTHPRPDPVVFTICDDCGTASEFTDPSLTDRLTRRAREADFQIASTMLELRGRCHACSTKEAE